MRLSCLPVSFFGAIRSGEMSIAQWAELAVKIGFDAIDLSILFLDNSSADELADMHREIESAGTCVAVVNTYPDFTHLDPNERERELSRLAEHIRISADIGAEMVRITAGQAHPETGRSEGIEWVVDSFRQSADAAERMGVRLVYENHSKPGVWQYWDFSHPADIFLEIADAIKDMTIGILFDTANPITDMKEPVPILEKSSIMLSLFMRRIPGNGDRCNRW